jgi:hypothetical protein
MSELLGVLGSSVYLLATSTIQRYVKFYSYHHNSMKINTRLWFLTVCWTWCFKVFKNKFQHTYVFHLYNSRSETIRIFHSVASLLLEHKSFPYVFENHYYTCDLCVQSPVNVLKDAPSNTNFNWYLLRYKFSKWFSYATRWTTGASRLYSPR